MNAQKAARVARVQERRAATAARHERFANHVGSITLLNGMNAAVYEKASLLVGEDEWGVRFAEDTDLAARLGVGAPLHVIGVYDENDDRVAEHIVRSLA